MYTQQSPAKSKNAPPLLRDGLGMLTRKLYFHMFRSAGRLFQKYDASVEQYIVLATLAEEDGVTQQELVKRCISDPRTMGKMVDVLEKRGWVKRAPHQTDRRAWQIMLSAEGRKKHQLMEKALIPQRAIPGRVLGAEKVEELKQMIALLSDELDPDKWLSADGKPVG